MKKVCRRGLTGCPGSSIVHLANGVGAPTHTEDTMNTQISAADIIREGRQVVRYARGGRRVVIKTLPTAFGAAIYRRALIRTDFGRKGRAS